MKITSHSVFSIWSTTAIDNKEKRFSSIWRLIEWIENNLEVVAICDFMGFMSEDETEDNIIDLILSIKLPGEILLYTADGNEWVAEHSYFQLDEANQPVDDEPTMLADYEKAEAIFKKIEVLEDPMSDEEKNKVIAKQKAIWRENQIDSLFDDEEE